MCHALEPRDVCWRCRRPQRVCICKALRPMDSRTRIVFVQHPRESRVPVSTCRIAHLSLTNSEMHVALSVEESEQLRRIAQAPGTAVLFPGEGATDAREVKVAPQTLIVIDGTWSNAKKVLTRSPALAKLPRISLSPRRASNYRIRKEPAEYCVSTIEAVAEILGQFEGEPGRFDGILGAFDAMVDAQLHHKDNKTGPSRYKVHKVRQVPRQNPLGEFMAQWPNLVAAYAESNAWPKGSPSPGKAELIQADAVHMATGTRFSTVLAPRQPLGTNVPAHLGLSKESIEAGEGLADAQARWKAFLPGEAVLCTWGRYSADILSDAGWAPSRRVDLRAAMKRMGVERTDGLEATASRLGVTVPASPRRTERRIAALVGLLGALHAR